MALKSDVNWKYRRIYNSRMTLPDDQERQMRSEIQALKTSLIRKQKRMEKSDEFSADEQILHELENVSLRKLKTPRQVWMTWNKLRQYEESANSSITGKKALRQKTIESLHMKGYDFINQENIAEFGEFMDFVRDNYSVKSIGGSGVVANFFAENKELDEDELERSFDDWLMST